MFNFSLGVVSVLINSVTFFISYLIAATVMGYSVALLAYALGDDTAVDLGRNTLNPFAHVDMLGLFLFAVSGIGWGLHTPIDPGQIQGRWHYFKKFLLYIASPIVAILLSVVAFLLVFLLLGSYSKGLVYGMVSYGNSYLSQEYIAALYPQASSLIIMVSYILITIIYVSILCALFNVVSNCYRAILCMVGDVGQGGLSEGLLALGISIGLILLFADTFRWIMLMLILIIGHLVLLACGAL